MRKPDFITCEIAKVADKRKLPAILPDHSQVDVVILDYEQRYLRRRVITCVSGKLLLVDLPTATVLENGDSLPVKSGGYIKVKAADEELLEIRSNGSHQMTIIAYHLGNRHLPVQIESVRLLIKDDHVIKAMLIKLGAQIRHVKAPFNPEGGAYGLGRTHGHDHDHDHKGTQEYDQIASSVLNRASDAFDN